VVFLQNGQGDYEKEDEDDNDHDVKQDSRTCVISILEFDLPQMFI
jgi:hypothetical protein